MIIYNVTIKVDRSIASDWLTWLQKEHIPQVLETGCFEEAVVHRLLETDDEEGPTYAIQYKAESKSQYNRYIEIFAPVLRDKSFEKWGNRFIAFRSVMQVVN
jgi:hypothetical protein